jgi:hypothetical protein
MVKGQAPRERACVLGHRVLTLKGCGPHHWPKTPHDNPSRGRRQGVALPALPDPEMCISSQAKQEVPPKADEGKDQHRSTTIKEFFK